VASELEIRDAADDELDEVASLIVDAYAEYAARMSPDAWSSFAHDIANVRGRMADTELVVAARDGYLVGTVTLYTQGRGVRLDTLGVRLLAVLPSERGTGVGHALMSHAIERARAYDKQRVVLTTTVEMDAAREMYQKMGFWRFPELDHEPAPGVRAEGFALDL
jgi:GNAT superfamily N-acetyltransferase